MRRAALLLTMAVGLPSMAAAGPIDGRWSLHGAPRQCARKLDEADAPATIKNHRFDQYEAHCDWRQLTLVAPGLWTAPGRCSVEGDETRGPMRFTLAGDTLAMRTPDGETTRLRRCPH